MNYDAVLVTAKVQYSLYKYQHPMFDSWVKTKHKTYTVADDQKILLGLLPMGKSLWIDSFGYALTDVIDVIAVEDKKYKNLFKSLPTVYYKDLLLSKQTNTLLSKIVKPKSVVFYFSPLFKYQTLIELIDNVNMLSDAYSNCDIFIALDTIFLDFNKIKFKLDFILEEIQEKLNCEISNLNTTKYLIHVRPISNH